MDTSEVKNLPASRALLYAQELKKEDIDKPFIGIIYSQNNVCPGHYHLDKLADYIAQGVREAGGTPVKMNAGVGVCDGIAMGHDGMKYSLPSRELNADCVEDMVRSHGIFDGIALIPACDKNNPGYLMAAARLNLPTICVTAGPMKPGKYKGRRIDVIDTFAARGQYANKKMTEEEYEGIVANACPGAGSCAGLFTANSMACVTEALGLSLSGCATAHALGEKKKKIAIESGKRAVGLVREKVYAKDIMTKEAFENALAVDMAIGASTNTVLHIPAIAKEAGYEFNLDTINAISKMTPNLVRLSPAKAGDVKYGMDDFDRAGGVPVVMEELLSAGLLCDAKTVGGRLSYVLKGVKNRNKKVIRTIDNPYSETGGIAVLKGTLAPKGAIIKESGIDPSVPRKFRGKAVVFESEEEATEYINSGNVQADSVLVIRYEGRAGGPGMREMLYPTSAIVGIGKDKEVALITDGRFSGGTSGMCIGHVEPEARLGGAIAFVYNGDEIEIDLTSRRLDLLVDEKEMIKRRNEKSLDIKSKEKQVPPGILQKYMKHILETEQ